MSSNEQLERGRSSKPLMEKRRRARINDSLLQLKNLVLDALNKNNPRHSKLEKADILEMTVRYLRSMHRQQLSGMVPHTERANIAQYQTGYAECMHEVSRYLNATSNANNVSNRGIILHKLTTKEATERHIQASLLNHLVTQSIDYNTPSGEGTIREQKNTSDTPNRASNHIPTLQFYTSNEPHSVTSSLDASSYSLMEETVSGGPSNPSSSVFSGVGSVAAVDPIACPSINYTGPMTGEEITLVLPQNLVYSGQIPTHVIPIYAASPPMISQAPPQPALSSSSLPVMLTPTSAPGNHGNGNASTSLGNDVASVSGRFAFIPTPPTSSAPNSKIDSSSKPRQSSTSSQSTLNDEAFLYDFKSRDINPSLTPPPLSISSPISSASSAARIQCNIIKTTPPLTTPPSATPPSPTTRTTTIKQPSQTYSLPIHTTLTTEHTTDVTKTRPNQITYRFAAPTQSTTSSTMPTSAARPTLRHHSNSTTSAFPAHQEPITSYASTTLFIKRDSTNSYVPKVQLSSVSPPTERFNMNPPEPLPGIISNRAIIKLSVNKPDIGSIPTRSRSPHRTPRPPQPHRTRSIPAPPLVPGPPQPPGTWSIPAPSLVPGPPQPHHVDPNRNEIRDVNELGVGREVTWRPW